MSKRNANKKSKSVAKSAPLQDLIVLVADKDIKETIEGLLTKRTRSLGIRPVQYKVLPNNEHDPGCLDRSAELLASFCTTHAHAMVIFDREGCGQDTESRSELEATVETALRKAGWGDRTAAIVIDPELENWVWSPSPHVADCLGWRDPKQSLRDWLLENEFLATPEQIKPTEPKRAMHDVLRLGKVARSSSIYRAIAEKVSMTRCTDPAFIKFRETLQTWFPIQNS